MDMLIKIQILIHYLIINGYNNIGDKMIVRLGYACSSVTLDKVTSSSTYTYTNFLKEKDYSKLDRVIISNLEDLEKILDYNIKNNIHFYRLSSKIIPLATKDDVSFDYLDKYIDYYKKIDKKIKDNNMRVDFHLDQYAVLNSVKKEVIDNTFKELVYHYKLLEYLNIKDKVLILHVGSNQFGKDNSIKRFINSFNKLPDYIKKSIVIENDDKIFNVDDLIKLSEELNIRIVLDYHHHICNKSDNIDFNKIFSKWEIPKIHFSSPKNNTKKDFRSHNDYIDSDKFIEFIENIKEYKCNVDIMIEAKKKDDALFRLIRELKYKTNYKFIDETTFIV